MNQNKKQIVHVNQISNRNWLPVVFAAFLISITSATIVSANDDDPKPELTIKDIMVKAHKPAEPTESIYLLKKVATGKATQEEATQLHAYYVKMAALTPTKGEQASWTEKTTALVAAAKAAVDKEEGFKAKLLKASDCAACHKAHKN